MVTQAVTRLAMWSGPRNLSTAMMRSFGNRPDTVVQDEPFYAWYLAETGIDHPGAAEIIELGETSQERVIESIVGSVPDTVTLHYQKHITTHVLPTLDLSWLPQVEHCFLIRDPVRVVASYAHKRAELVIDDLGYAVQRHLFQRIQRNAGVTPLVVDADRFLQSPESHLRAMCEHVGVSFHHSMLQWSPGVRDTDGPWHKHWYHSVIASTGFIPWSADIPELSGNYRQIAAQCRDDYDALLTHALVAPA